MKLTRITDTDFRDGVEIRILKWPTSQTPASNTPLSEMVIKLVQTDFACGCHAPSCYRNLLLSSAYGNIKGVTAPKILLEPKFNIFERVDRKGNFENLESNISGPIIADIKYGIALSNGSRE